MPNFKRTTDEMITVSMVIPGDGIPRDGGDRICGDGREEEREEQCQARGQKDVQGCGRQRAEEHRHRQH